MLNKRSAFCHPMRLYAALLAIFCLTGTLYAASKADPNRSYRPRTRFWLPAQADIKTQGLFQMEGEKEIDLDDDNLLADFMDGKTEISLVANANDITKANALKDSSIVRPQAAEYTGACAPVKSGRFGQGLILTAGDSAIVTPNYHIDAGFRVGAWFKPDALNGTLLALESSPRSPAGYALQAEADGRVVLLNYGNKIAESKPLLTAGAWHHVGIVTIPHFGNSGLNGAHMEIYIDGRLSITHSETVWHMLCNPILPMSGRVFAGNSPALDSALRGIIDDLHIDSSGVTYYPWKNELQSTETSDSLAASPPVFRSDEDLLLVAPMDGSPALRKGKAELTSTTGEGLHPFVDGIRAQAANVGANHVLPRYAFTEPVPAGKGTVEFWFSPFDWDNGKGDVSLNPAYRTEGVPLIRLECQTPDGNVLPFLQLSASEMKNHQRRWVKLDPGTWFHMLITWDKSGPRYYVNNVEVNMQYPTFFQAWKKPPEGSIFTAVQVGSKTAFSNGLLYRGCSTLIDELRVYRTAFSPPERANAYNRYLPDATLSPLPFAYVDSTMSAPLKKINTEVHVLSAEAAGIATVDAEFADATGKTIGSVSALSVTDGSAGGSITNADVAFGTYQATYTFKGGDGRIVKTMTVAHERPAPPWFGLDDLGCHPGEVLPGWDPITVASNELSLWNRRITFDARGWPGPILSGGAPLLDPVEITLTTATGPVALTPAGDAVRFISKANDIVVTEGTSTGGGFTLTTRIATEFDGFMKVTTTLTGPEGAAIQGLRLDFPLHLAADQFYGFWAGDNWFRGACDYRRLPEGDGTVFRSNKTGRNHGSDKYRLRNGRVSFMPHLALTDDVNGLSFLAENDRNWTQSWEIPAQEIVREKGRTLMRLNLVNEVLSVGDGLEYVFAIQPTPVKAPSPKGRALARVNSFRMVDGFSGKPVTQEFGNHLDFQLHPENMDWDAAKKRMEARWRDKPIMYIDRIWHRPAPDAVEYAGTWLGWGGAWRYLPEFQNYQLWYLNEWLRRGVMRGFYIDDCWTKATLAPAHGLAYLRDKEKEFPENYEWGFEFFDFRNFLKRLRWLFYDNGMDPLIWCHVTQTAYIPMLSFTDLLLEGEDRFPAWGRKADFIDVWGMDRLRYANPQKSGLTFMWMNKIGNDLPAPAPMPHWGFKQQRSMTAGLLVHDISDGSNAAGGETRALMPALDDATFIGYWDPANPFTSKAEGCVLSVYRLPDRDILVLVNGSDAETVARFELNPDNLPAGWTVGALIVNNLDTQVPPEGEDILTIAKDVKLNDDMIDGMLEDESSDSALNQLVGEMEQDQAKEKQMEEMSEEEREKLWFTHTNLKFENGILRARIRRHDYRLFELRKSEE